MTMEIQKGDLYNKDGFDFRVHEIREGQVYGALYREKDRGNITQNTEYWLRRRDVDKFIAEAPELVAERD